MKIRTEREKQNRIERKNVGGMGRYNILNERGREMCNGKVNRKRNKVNTDGNRGQEKD